MSSTTLAVIARPNPVPCTRLTVVFSSRVKLSNRCGRYSSLMPMPVSATMKRYRFMLPAAGYSSAMRSIDFPAGVYLIALLMMLMSTCSMRSSSPSTLKWCTESCW